MKKLIKLSALVLMIATIGGCASFGASLTFGGMTSSDEQRIASSAIGPFENNSTVQLEAGRYRGDLQIEANKVRLEGAGSRSTRIEGNVHVNGNSNTVRGVNITGNVYLNGNNNTLSSVRVDGEVVSSGNNNSW